MAAKKNTVRRRKLTTREPKKIIKRKKQTARKPKPASAKSNGRATSTVDSRAKDLKTLEQIKKLQDKGVSLKEAAEKHGMRPAKARRLLMKDAVRPKDKIVGTEAEVAKKIKKARDEEEISWGVIRARTGMTTKKVKALYASAGGKVTSAAKKTTAKAKPARGTRKAKTNTRTTKQTTRKSKATAKSTTKAAAKPRAPKTRKTKAAKVEAEASSGLTSRQRRRASKNAESKKRLDVLHDLDTTDKQVTEAIEGRTLEVTRAMDGRKITPTFHTVGSIKQIAISQREGRVVHFVDENQQNRVITAREVTGLK